jgi:hypothetical protein
MVLDAPTARVSRRLDATLKRGRNTRRAIQGLLAELASSAPPVMHTRGARHLDLSLARAATTPQLDEAVFVENAQSILDLFEISGDQKDYAKYT